MKTIFSLCRHRSRLGGQNVFFFRVDMSSVNVKNIMNFQYISVLIFSVQISIGSTNFTFRKHKVHNIVLYPDKHSWCTSTPIKQVISAVGCGAAEIDNRVCLGACFSYSIPRTLPADNGDEISSYYDSCQPVKTSWIPVELTCGDGSNQTKHVQSIDGCRCASCGHQWESESPRAGADVGATSGTETSRYLELMKPERDEHADGENDTADASDATAEIPNVAATVNSTRLEKDVWIRGPHHSKVLLRKQTVSSKTSPTKNLNNISRRRYKRHEE